MSGNRTKVVLTRRLPEPVEIRLKELFDVTLRDHQTPMSRAELVNAVKTCDVLVPTITDKIDAGLLGQAGENLKLIANFGAGIDHIDVETARQRGILVSNTPDVVTEDTADMAMALLMAVVRKIPQGLQAMQSGEWTGWSPTAYLGGRLGGRRLGILGMGRIGQAVARRGGIGGIVDGCFEFFVPIKKSPAKKRGQFREVMGRSFHPALCHGGGSELVEAAAFLSRLC